MTAKLKPNWTMPSPPVDGAVAMYFNDGVQIWLCWYDAEQAEPATQDSRSDITWPFKSDNATHADLEALGFKNAEGVL